MNHDEVEFHFIRVKLRHAQYQGSYEYERELTRVDRLAARWRIANLAGRLLTLVVGTAFVFVAWTAVRDGTSTPGDDFVVWVSTVSLALLLLLLILLGSRVRLRSRIWHHANPSHGDPEEATSGPAPDRVMH